MNPFEEHGPRRSGFYFLQGYHAHMYFYKWVRKLSADIKDTLEIGCSYFGYYSLFFNDLGIEYSGLDIDEKAIQYRKKLNPEHEFFHSNFYSFESSKSYDLVFGHMVASGEIELEGNLKLIKGINAVSNKYGFIVIWGMNPSNLCAYKECLKSEGCEDITSVFIPTKLPKGPSYECALHWRVA